MPRKTRAYIAFPIPDDLRNRILNALDDFRQSGSVKGYADHLIDLVDEVSALGMNYFFSHPAEMVGIGGLAKKSIDVTINSGKKAVIGVSRQLARRMDDDQLLIIAGFLEGLVLEVETDEED